MTGVGSISTRMSKNRIVFMILFYILTLSLCDRHTCPHNSFTSSTSLNQQSFYGHVLDTVTAMSVLDCAGLCSRVSRCSGYKFHDSNKTCHIRGNAEIKRMAESHFTSYIKYSRPLSIRKTGLKHDQNPKPRRKYNRKYAMSPKLLGAPKNKRKHGKLSSPVRRAKHYRKSSQKPSQEPSRKPSHKPSRKPTHKPSRKPSEEPGHQNYLLGRKQLRKPTKLLLLPTGRREHQVLQLGLHDHSMLTNPFPKMKNIARAVYIAAKKKLLLATSGGKGPKLFFVRLGGRERSNVNIKHRVKGMAVDEEKQFVFLIRGRWDKCTLMGMTDEGKRIREITDLEKMASDIAVDPERKHIYAVYIYEKITQYTYKGERISIIKGQIYRSLCLDSRRDALYYLHYKMGRLNIVTRNLSTSDSGVIPRPVSYNIAAFYACLGNIYMSYSKSGHMETIVLNDSGEIIKTINTKGRVHYVMVCV